MIFRAARHTNDLARITAFYTELLGLDALGSFRNHAGYDGVFLGLPGSDWHLEFTTSSYPAARSFDADDLLVFFPTTRTEHEALLARIDAMGLAKEVPRNPFWRNNSVLVRDPDGGGVVVSGVRVGRG